MLVCILFLEDYSDGFLYYLVVLEANHRKQFRLLGFSWVWDVDLSCGFEWIFSHAQSFCSVLKPSSIDAQKKRVSFPFLQEGLPFVISSWGHVSEFGFDMFVRCYERMWVSYYVGDLLRFFVGIRFHFSNPIGRNLNSNRRSKTFLIFTTFPHRQAAISIESSL